MRRIFEPEEGDRAQPDPDPAERMERERGLVDRAERPQDDAHACPNCGDPSGRFGHFSLALGCYRCRASVAAPSPDPFRREPPMGAPELRRPYEGGEGFPAWAPPPGRLPS